MINTLMDLVQTEMIIDMIKNFKNIPWKLLRQSINSVGRIKPYRKSYKYCKDLKILYIDVEIPNT